MTDPVVDVQVQVALPPASVQIADAVAKFTLDVLAAKKAGASGLTLISAAVTAAVSDLVAVGGAYDALKNELEVEPLAVAEALAIAGFKVARGLSSK